MLPRTALYTLPRPLAAPRRLALPAALGLCLLLACGEDPPPPAPSVSAPSAAPVAPTAAPSAAAPKANSAPADGGVAKEAAPAKPKIDPNLKGRDRVLAEARVRPFKPEDLAANPPTNTDPFHNNLDQFITKPVNPGGKQGPLADRAPEYNLEDLRLTMVIIDPTDGARSRAMFIDPKGIGVAVVRGNRVGRAAALVKRVISDGVIFEFTEDLGQGKTRSIDRTVQLRPPEEKNR